MPNHVHAIIILTSQEQDNPGCYTAPDQATEFQSPEWRPADPSKQRFGNPQSGALGTIVGAFKSAVTRKINILRDTPGEKLWQTNYHEHIVRDEKELNNIRWYIRTNPQRWNEDRFNPDNLKR